MDTYIQDLFSKDDIGFKPVNDVKDSTKIFVFTLNKYIKDRDGKNITRTEIIRLAEEIQKLGEKIKAKMNSLLQELENQKKPRKTEKSKKEKEKSSSLIGQDIKDVKMINADSNEESTVGKAEQTGGNVEHSVPEVSTIDLLNNINNNPCSSSITQCGDFVTSCGQSGGGVIQNKNYELFESTLNNFKKFSISDQNKKILYDLVKIYTTTN
tara:strand:+ start:212 stop:844 length:633 start_codon:yes stop_codon:yes gene_type:complete